MVTLPKSFSSIITNFFGNIANLFGNCQNASFEFLPDPIEMEQAKNIVTELSQLEQIGNHQDIKIVFRKGAEEVEISFPLKILHLLLKIMEQMALGNSVILMPIQRYCQKLCPESISPSSKIDF